MRKTKIICTIGPSSENTVMLEKLITGGIMMNKPGSTNFLHVKEIE